jgi:hypothetical protein
MSLQEMAVEQAYMQGRFQGVQPLLECSEAARQQLNVVRTV